MHCVHAMRACMYMGTCTVRSMMGSMMRTCIRDREVSTTSYLHKAWVLLMAVTLDMDAVRTVNPNPSTQITFASVQHACHVPNTPLRWQRCVHLEESNEALAYRFGRVRDVCVEGKPRRAKRLAQALERARSVRVHIAGCKLADDVLLSGACPALLLGYGQLVVEKKPTLADVNTCSCRHHRGLECGRRGGWVARVARSRASLYQGACGRPFRKGHHEFNPAAGACAVECGNQRGAFHVFRDAVADCWCWC